jgi:predicted branched-subunit amino acid permease
VTVLATWGGPFAAVTGSTLLGSRNLFYGLRIRQVLEPGRLRSVPAAHLTIDEATAMALAHQDRPVPRPALACWMTGLSVSLPWSLGTLLGALGAGSIEDPLRWGLDAAVPAAFLALTPVLPVGRPVLCAAVVPLLFLRGTR